MSENVVQFRPRGAAAGPRPTPPAASAWTPSDGARQAAGLIAQVAAQGRREFPAAFAPEFTVADVVHVVREAERQGFEVEGFALDAAVGGGIALLFSRANT